MKLTEGNEEAETAASDGEAAAADDSAAALAEGGAGDRWDAGGAADGVGADNRGE